MTLLGLGAVAVTAALLLLRLGLHLGDRPDDARSSVRAAWSDQADGGYPAARVRVANAGREAVVVSVDLRPASGLALALHQPVDVRVARPRRRPRPPAGLVLGAVDGRCSRSWDVPLAGLAHPSGPDPGRRPGRLVGRAQGGSAPGAKVAVRLYQAGGRTRLFTHLVATPDGPPPVADLDDGAPTGRSQLSG